MSDVGQTGEEGQPGAPTICLCMLVKNEQHIIRRAIESALPFIDSWIIADTGSTDETKAVIRDVVGELPHRDLPDDPADWLDEMDTRLLYGLDVVPEEKMDALDTWLEGKEAGKDNRYYHCQQNDKAK